MIREKIVSKLNAVPFDPNLEFTQEEIEYMLTRYLSTHSKNKIEDVKFYYYNDGHKEKIGLKSKITNEQHR